MTEYEKVLDRLRGELDQMRNRGEAGPKLDHYRRMLARLIKAGPGNAAVTASVRKTMDNSRDMSASKFAFGRGVRRVFRRSN